jgi:hypothetical protein
MLAAEALSALPLAAVADAAETEDGAESDATPPEIEDVPVAIDYEDGAALEPIPEEVEALLRDLDDADAFELDARLRTALALEQRLESRLGPLLAWVLRHRLHRSLGYATRESYLRERLGFEPSWGRALLRIERAASTSPTYARAYRDGALTPLQALALAPLLLSELDERWIEAWVSRAARFTLRRLREDVEQALTLRDTDFAAFLRTGGLPQEDRDALTERSEEDRETGAQLTAAQETSSVRCFIDADVGRLLRAVICSMRRQLERQTGRLPTEGEALGTMLELALAAWQVYERPKSWRHAVFERDGWRCAVPGCTSMRSLHEHHIVFRSAGGTNARENRVTLCAFHHLRGVHRGVVGCTGEAPYGLRFTLGVRRGRRSLAVYGSGDRLISMAKLGQERAAAARASSSSPGGSSAIALPSSSSSKLWGAR